MAEPPQINGPDIFGVRPLSPIIYRLPVSGTRPMTYSVEGLPSGVTFDAQKGILGGRLTDYGTNILVFTARNAEGVATRRFRLVGSREFPLTPLLGFNTFGGLGSCTMMNEKNVRASVQALFDKGLVDYGYCYCNLDDGWQGNRGGVYFGLLPNEKFPNLAGLFDWIHSEGLKAGLYSTPWYKSYAGYQGGSSRTPAGEFVDKGWSGGPVMFEAEDARQLAAWGCDYWKYDWKLDRMMTDDYSAADLAERMSIALRSQNRDMVFELSNTVNPSQPHEIDRLAKAGTMLRYEDDMVDVWTSDQLTDVNMRKWAHGIRDIWQLLKRWQHRTRAAHWVFPGPLRVGMLGGLWKDKPLRPTRLTIPEQYSHISLWCIWGSPIIIGAPIDKLDQFTLGLLTNQELLAVHQDALCCPSVNLDVRGGEAVYRVLENGDVAVGLFNTDDGDELRAVSVDLAQLGLTGEWKVRDLWEHRDLAPTAIALTAAKVPRHGCRVYRLSRVTGEGVAQ